MKSSPLYSFFRADSILLRHRHNEIYSRSWILSELQVLIFMLFSFPILLSHLFLFSVGWVAVTLYNADDPKLILDCSYNICNFFFIRKQKQKALPLHIPTRKSSWIINLRSFTHNLNTFLSFMRDSSSRYGVLWLANWSSVLYQRWSDRKISCIFFVNY